MINLKRLHNTHFQYPNIKRRGGKTTYCLDKLIRTAQLGEFEHISYVSNKMNSSMNALSMLVRMLIDEKIEYKHIVTGTVEVNKCKISFISTETAKNKSTFDFAVYDTF